METCGSMAFKRTRHVEGKATICQSLGATCGGYPLFFLRGGS
jgi:hypothetical protein